MIDGAEGPGEVGGGGVAHLAADDLDAEIRRPQKIRGLFTADKVMILQQGGIRHAFEAFCQIDLVDEQRGGHPLQREFLGEVRFNIIGGLFCRGGLRAPTVLQGFSDGLHIIFFDPISFYYAG